jgi:two-component system, LuxR family, sensor kinase FixL
MWFLSLNKATDAGRYRPTRMRVACFIGSALLWPVATTVAIIAPVARQVQRRFNEIITALRSTLPITLFGLSMSEYVTDSLKERCRATLALVALLVLLNQLLLQPSLWRLTTDAPVINIAGRQRMLSQRLAKAALALESTDSKTRRRYRDELDRVLQLWTASHDGLRHGSRAMSLPGGNSQAVSAALDELEPLVLRIRTAAEQLIRDGARTQPGEAAARDDLAVILGAEGEYLERMDKLVGQFEREARDRVGRMLWTGWVVMGLILLALAAIGLLIVRPASELIRRQMEELRRARDELEDRVRQRTRELEIAKDRHHAIVEQFSHVARTTTIGEMASGLAHELNQPLGAIANYAEGCLVELATPRPAVQEVNIALEKLLATTLRAARIIERIRKFVTRQELRRELFEPNVIVDDVLAILRDEMGQRGVALTRDLAPDLPKLLGDPVQIQQVLVNLVRNAFDSIAVAQPLDPTVLIQTKQDDSGGVEFCVTDNGEGIEQDRLTTVFDAYFSTRAGGLGMGLAISRTIIEAHEGRLTVKSAPGITTSFQFTLPAGRGDDDGTNSLHRG